MSFVVCTYTDYCSGQESTTIQYTVMAAIA